MNLDYLNDKYDDLETDSIKTYRDLKEKRGRIFPPKRNRENSSARKKHCRRCKECLITFVLPKENPSQQHCTNCKKAKKGRK